MQPKTANKPVKKINHSLPAEYLDLVKVWQNQAYEEVMIDYRQSIQENPAFSAVLNHSPCVNAIIDLRRQQFDFISSNTGTIFGYESSHFMDKGLDFCNEIIHPEDLVKTWKLIKNIWDFIFTMPPADQAQFKFNYDYRSIKPDGKEVRILAQNSVLQSDSIGNITHVLGVY